jgi:hypothetical protein
MPGIVAKIADPPTTASMLRARRRFVIESLREPSLDHADQPG